MAISAALKKYKDLILPVEKHELQYFLPLFIIKLLASFTYTILNATKDTVIVTASGSGAEAILVLKGGLVLGVAFCFMLAYSKLSNKLTRENLFYAVLLPFVVFFLIYGFVLYPCQDSLSFNNSADILLNIIGDNHKHWVAVYRYWMHSLFFVFAEMWGGIVIGLLFWGFANQITSIAKAAKFYALYTVGGHIGTIIAGQVTTITAKLNINSFTVTVQLLMLIAIFATLSIMLAYWWTNKYAASAHSSNISIKVTRKTKNKLSLSDSIKFIINSPYLWLIALMVIGYGISINMVEVTWKSLLKTQYPNAKDYQAFMGSLQTAIGGCSLLIALLFSNTIIGKLGWRLSAFVPPIILSFMSLLFFALFFYYKNTSSISLGLLGVTPLFLVVIVGAIHNVACKSIKYSLFDPTKEMAYIPLDEESKTKGKAAVDVVGGRFGKSAASWSQIALIDLFGTGSVLGIAHILLPVVFIVVIAWMFAVNKLGFRLEALRASDKSKPKIGKNINKYKVADALI